MSNSIFVRLVTLVLFAVCVTSCTTESPVTPTGRILKLGGLFSITGNWNTLGRAGNAAAELAVEDVNAHFRGLGIPMEVQYLNIDTKLIPDSALAGVKYHADRSTKVILGPQSSAEVFALKNFADSNGVLIVSPSSTAGVLAIEGDNILRMCPSDFQEGTAMGAMMRFEGRTTMVPVWRDDIGNTGLKDAAAYYMGMNGGRVNTGLSYPSDLTDLSGLVDQIRSLIVAARVTSNASDIAIFLAGFDEVATLFAAIPANDSILRSVHWYGGDGTAMSEALLPYSNFLAQVSYPNPVFSIGDGEWIADPIKERIKARCGVDADAYSLAVYDAVWILARAFSVSTAGWTTPILRDHVITEAGNTFGVTGWTKLNAAGDKEFGNYNMMAVRIVATHPRWVRLGKYSSTTKTYRPD